MRLVEEHPSEYKHISKDNLRAMFNGGKWSKTNEKFILHIRDELILQTLGYGCSVIVDDTNLHPKHEKALRNLAKTYPNVTFEIIDKTDVPLKELFARNEYREERVPDKVIKDMYRDFIEVKPKPVRQNPTLSSAYQYDLDGTLALFGDANPYDRDFSYDKVNYPVFDQLRMQQNAGYKIIILSGRNGENEGVTKEWLSKNGIHPDLFIMRKVGDRRKDYEIKEEMFREYVLPKYYVEAIYDDRDQAVNKWRDMGLVCFQVARGDF